MSLSLWDKIDASVAEPSAEVSSEIRSGSRKRTWQQISRAGDVAGTLLWALSLTKLFFFDFDRYLADRLGSPFDRLVQFRFLVILVVVALILVLHKRSWAVLLYAAIFPLIVGFWKIPRLLIWLRSWNFLLALVTLLASLLKRFRLRFLIRTLEIVVCVVAIVSSTT